MRLVIAVGGNALLKRGEPLDASVLKKNCELAANQIAKVAKEHDVVVVHGNGPQVGLLALQSASYQEVPSYPFDVLDAESQGMIGYLLQQALGNALQTKQAATLLTQVRVSPDDVAFGNPTKPIGPWVHEADKAKLMKQYNWSFVEKEGVFRRVVPSPMPVEIIEMSAIESLLNSHVVIAGGGGGIPCVQSAAGLTGIEAVIDKDATAACIAKMLSSDRLIILTDVDGVYQSWGQSDQQLLRDVSMSDLQSQDFEAGSMGPKVKAACQFVAATKQPACIGHLANLAEIMTSQSGTRVT